MADALTFFEILWYVLLMFVIIAYGMLDGFDLGVGALHLFSRKDEERRIFLNAIGPVWDGNEVWLVVLVGGLFAGFPFAYATLFSAFYIPTVLLIFALIFRAVALEFRSKQPMKWWRHFWDTMFCVASIGISLSFGVLLGNLIVGVPLDENFNYVGGIFWQFISLYPIIVGLFTLSLFMLHGAIYLIMKTEGEIQAHLKRWIQPCMIFFIIAYVITTLFTLIYHPHMVDRFRDKPYLFIVVVLNVLLIANIPRQVFKKNFGFAFISSCLNVACFLTVFALGTFPELIRSSIDPANNSITLWNATASLKTLQILTVIAAIGLPLVFAYGFYVYKIFHGKVQLDHMSY